MRDNGAGDFFLMRKRKSIERKETRQQKKYESHERCCLIAVAVVVAAFAYIIYTFTYIHTHTHIHACIHTYIHTYMLWDTKASASSASAAEYRAKRDLL